MPIPIENLTREEYFASTLKRIKKEKKKNISKKVSPLFIIRKKSLFSRLRDKFYPKDSDLIDLIRDSFEPKQDFAEKMNFGFRLQNKATLNYQKDGEGLKDSEENDEMEKDEINREAQSSAASQLRKALQEKAKEAAKKAAMKAAKKVAKKVATKLIIQGIGAIISFLAATIEIWGPIVLAIIVVMIVYNYREMIGAEIREFVSSPPAYVGKMFLSILGSLLGF